MRDYKNNLIKKNIYFIKMKKIEKIITHTLQMAP